MYYSILFVIVLIFSGCAGSDSSGNEEDAFTAPEHIETRTVCVADDDPDLLAVLYQAVDAWNEHSYAAGCTACQEGGQCLCRTILRELGHALDMHDHLRADIMHGQLMRSPNEDLPPEDLHALPWHAPVLLVVDDDETCAIRIGWGYLSPL